MQLKSRSAVVLILGIFWGIIGISMITGNWQTKATSEEIIVNSPNDIKGWMTLTDVSEYFEVSVPELVKIFELPSDVEPDKPVKDIAADTGKETDEFREILAAYLGVQEDSNTSVPAQTEQPKDTPVTLEGSSGTGSGTGSDEVIKGRMTLREVEYVTKVPADYICKQLEIPENADRSKALRDLSQEYGFEVDSIRDIVAEYKP